MGLNIFHISVFFPVERKKKLWKRSSIPPHTTQKLKNQETKFYEIKKYLATDYPLWRGRRRGKKSEGMLNKSKRFIFCIPQGGGGFRGKKRNVSFLFFIFLFSFSFLSYPRIRKHNQISHPRPTPSMFVLLQSRHNASETSTQIPWSFQLCY